MSENQENVVLTLVDENDESFDAELIDSIAYDGHIYNLFITTYNLLFKLLLPVENELLLDEIWDAYEAEMEEIEE